MSDTIKTTNEIQPLKKTTLVIGAAGFLGSHIARGLAESGVPVVGLASRQPHGICFDRFHIGRSELIGTLVTALEGCKHVIFAGGTTRPGSSMTSISSELSAEAGHVVDIAELCAARGVERFVFVSSGGAIYGQTTLPFIDEEHPTFPISNYGLAKLVAEHGLRIVSRRTGLCTIALRVSNPYGPGQQVKGGQGFVAAMVNAARTGEALELWGDGSVVRDFVYVDDVVQATLAALRSTCPPDTVNIGSGIGTSILEMVGSFERAIGRSLPVAYRPARSIDVLRIVLNISKAEKTLAWRPVITIEAGLRRVVERECLG